MEGGAIAGHYPRRGREPLRKNERTGTELLRRAIRDLGEQDPIVQECQAMLLLIARGEVGYRGRYVGERLRAIRDLLDRIQGRPRERQEHTGEVVHRIEIVEREDGAC